VYVYAVRYTVTKAPRKQPYIKPIKMLHTIYKYNWTKRYVMLSLIHQQQPGVTMNKQQQHIINTLIQPHINSGNKEQAKRMIDTLIRSARSSKAKQALQAFKANLG
jgi:hypothetical protein